MGSRGIRRVFMRFNDSKQGPKSGSDQLLAIGNISLSSKAQCRICDNVTLSRGLVGHNDSLQPIKAGPEFCRWALALGCGEVGGFVRRQKKRFHQRTFHPYTRKHPHTLTMAGIKRKQAPSDQLASKASNKKAKPAAPATARPPKTRNSPPVQPSSDSEGSSDSEILGPDAQERGEAETDSDPIVESDTTEHRYVSEGSSFYHSRVVWQYPLTSTRAHVGCLSHRS